MKKKSTKPVEKPAAKSTMPVVQKEKKTGKTLSSLRGMKDILPQTEWYWRRLSDVAQGLADAYGFHKIATPILEEASLFIRSLGRGTDVVDKEMYIFEDKDGSRVALRPEFTASIARAYIEHGMHVQPQPVKLWSVGPLFRHDRPQAGRYRQFHQFNVETLGVHDPAIDAELISVGYHFYQDLGIPTIVHMNSIGTPEDRQRYLVELVAYLRSKRSYLSEESKKRIVKNPLRVLDSKEEQDQAVLDEAPHILDWLTDESRQFFMKVLEYLDELGIPYHLNPRLVRGLDYYTDTVFEFYEATEEVASQNALGGGGRYNLLIEQMGGQPTPAAGFALGLERALIVLRRKVEAGEVTLPSITSSIYFAHLGEQSRRRALVLIEELRQAGILLNHNIGKTALKAQLEQANKCNVTHTIILGQKELQDGTIIIRDMTSGIQEIVDQKKLVREIERLLGGRKMERTA